MVNKAGRFLEQNILPRKDTENLGCPSKKNNAVGSNGLAFNK